MKLSFKDVVQSSTYEREASAVSKANITVATIVAFAIMLLADWGFGPWWFAVIPALWIAVTFLVAMPFMLFKVLAITRLGEQPGKARSVVIILDTLNYVVLAAAVYYGLNYLHQTFFN